MSTDDLREPEARVDRSDLLDRVQPGVSLFASRRDRLLVLLVLALALVPLTWLEQEAGDPASEPAQEAAEASLPVLPIHLNARVQRWMDEFETTRRHEFQDLLERRGRYEELIRAKLRDRGMPEELLYLAMMESGMSTRAVSHVEAVGLWQFMDETARQLGLRVDEYVDERRDPVRATDAALYYLEWLHDRFGSWYLAAAAYNAGPGRLERILELHADGRTGEEDLYWEVLRHLPLETREYVPKLVAATILGTAAERRGFDSSSGLPAYEYDVVFVPGGTRLTVVAESLDEKVQVLRDLNPHLIYGTTPPGEIYGVRVPPGGTPAVMASLGSVLPGARAD